MNDDWEQWPQTEGDESTLEGLALIAAIVFVIGMIVYIFI